MKSFNLRYHCVCLCLAAYIGLTLVMPAQADDTLPDVISARAHTALKKVGSGTYRKFGFSVYHATLWAPDGVWSAAKPYALELHYTRGLSSDTLADSTIDNIKDENVADEATIERWSASIKKNMPAVEDGDIMIGLNIPGKESALFLNGKELAHGHDAALTQAFFDIWLGPGADEDLRDALLGQKP